MFVQSAGNHQRYLPLDDLLMEIVRHIWGGWQYPMITRVKITFEEKELRAWFEGWSYCLSEINFTKTGYKTDGLIDLHIITDKDIEKKSSFAVMINSMYDRARLIKKRKND